MKRLITILLLAISGFASAQTYQLNYPDIRIGNSNTGKIVLRGSNVQFPFLALGSTTDSVVTIDNGIFKKVPRSQFSGGGSGAVSSVFGRTGDVVALSADYNAFYPLLASTYNNPTWINTLAYSKITGVPAFITTETDPTVPAYAKTLTAFSVIKPSTDALYEPIFSKNTGFNKNFGTSAGTVVEGSDSRIVNALSASTAASTYQTLANLSTDLTASATKYPNVNAVIGGLSNKANKIQKVYYADDYTDTFTGWSSTDSLNHGSAIWQILSANNYKDVKIVFSAKTYVPWMGPISGRKLDNVTFEGVSMPSFAQDLQHLQRGTILQGTWRILQPTNDLYMNDLGIDVGKDVTDAYYSGLSQEGFTNSYRLGIDLEWGRNRVYKNISVLVRNPTDPVHAFLEERGKGVYIDNVRLCFGYHGLTLKSQDINVVTASAYGQGAENLIIKAGEVDTYTASIYIGSFTSNQAPPEVSNSWVAIPKTTYGVYFDAQLPLTNININSLSISNADHGLEFSSKPGNVIGLVNIQSAIINSPNYGFVRSGDGKLSYINIAQLGVFGATQAAVFFTEGLGNDSGVKIGSLTTGGNTVGTGVYMRNNTQLEIDNYLPSYVTNAIDINAGVNFVLNNYNKGESVTNDKASGSLNPTSTNVIKNADNKIPYPITVEGTVSSITLANNSGINFGSDVGVGVVQARDYYNTQAVPLSIQPAGVQPVYFGSITPDGTTAKYQFKGGDISVNTLTGVGDRPVFVASDGTLKTGTSSGSGTVTNVSSANTDISVSSPTTTPVVTLNSSTSGGANTIPKRDSNGTINNTATGANTSIATTSTTGVGLLSQSTSGISVSSVSSTGKAARLETSSGTGQTLDIINNGTGDLLNGINTNGTIFRITNSGGISSSKLLTGTAGTDSILVHDNTSKLFKLVSPTYYSTGGGGGISGLTTNYLPKASSSTSIANSRIFDDGTNLGIGTGSPTYPLDIDGGASNGVARLTSSNAAGIRIKNTATNGKEYNFGSDLDGHYYIYNETNGKYVLDVDQNGKWFIGETGQSINIPNLTASQSIQTDASKNLVSVANTGTGSNVLATSPTLVTPTLGVATASSINKVTITAPTTSATLTLVQGSSLITSGANALTLTTTAATNATFPTGSGALGYQLTGSASLNFPSTTSNTTNSLTITVTGAAVGDVVSLGIDAATLAVTGNYSFMAYVSATNTVTVKFDNNNPVTTLDPAAATFKVKVFK